MTTRERRWLPTETILDLVRLGFRNTDIAAANAEATGYKPTSSAVTRRLQKMGVPPRRTSHKDLIWWTVRPEHSHDPIYYGLQAIDKERKGVQLSRQDIYRARVLKSILTSRGGPFVVDYRPDEYPDRGWIIIPARDSDTDIVVRPRGEDNHTLPQEGD